MFEIPGESKTSLFVRPHTDMHWNIQAIIEMCITLRSRRAADACKVSGFSTVCYLELWQKYCMSIPTWVCTQPLSECRILFFSVWCNLSMFSRQLQGSKMTKDGPKCSRQQSAFFQMIPAIPQTLQCVLLPPHFFSHWCLETIIPSAPTPKHTTSNHEILSLSKTTCFIS